MNTEELRTSADRMVEQSERIANSAEYPAVERYTAKAVAGARIALADAIEALPPRPERRTRAERIAYRDALLRVRKAKALLRSAEAHRASHEAVRCIPFGQPLLVGHHSERGHRAALRRSDDAMRRACEESKKADRMPMGASRAIMSDDSDAVEQLKRKLESLVRANDAAKECNRQYKKLWLAKAKELGRKPTKEENQALAYELMKTNPVAEGLLSWARAFPWMPKLSTNTAEQRRVKGRIEELERRAGQETREETVGEITVRENVELNRVQILFPSIPSPELRSHLKRNGFRWSPTERAWQRHLSAWAVTVAKDIANRKETNE